MAASWTQADEFTEIVKDRESFCEVLKPDIALKAQIEQIAGMEASVVTLLDLPITKGILRAKFSDGSFVYVTFTRSRKGKYRFAIMPSSGLEAAISILEKFERWDLAQSLQRLRQYERLDVKE